MKPEQKKLSLVVVLLAVAGGIYLWFGRSSSPLPDEIPFVCVESGKMFTLDRDDIPKFLPATNPETGHPTLLPVHEVDGKYYASERHARLLREPQVAEVNKYVDPYTLEVLESPR